MDQDSLVEALVAGRIAGAALDVFTQQPLTPESPLYQMENVLLSPHMAGITEDSLKAVGASVASQVRQLLRGELPKHLVNVQISALIHARLLRLGEAPL